MAKKKSHDEEVADELDSRDEKEEKVEKKIKLKLKTIRKYKAWLKMAIAKRDKKFVPVAKRTKSYYKNTYHPDWADEDDDAVTIQMVFSNIEVTKPSVFYRNPRIFVKPTQNVFMMKNGEQLDGPRAARLIEDAVNYVAYVNKLKRIVKKIRDDALILTYGVIFSGYEGETGINEYGEQYIKKESIYSIRISPFKFLVDPEATDCLEFSDARWVARESEIRFSDFKNDDWYENKEDAKPDSTGYGEKIKSAKGDVKYLIDYAGKDYKDSDDAKRITLYEMWIRPTAAQKRKLKEGRPGGKVVVLSMSSDKEHKVLKWPYKMEPYPFRGLAFFRDNDEFYPISDIAQYEQQLEELNKIRTAQLKHVKTFGDKKVLINKNIFDSEEEITKLNESGSGPFIGVDTEDIRKDVYVLQFGSAPSEMFLVDRKVQEDADRISGISDIRRGIPPVGIETATEVKEVSGLGGLRLMEKKDDMADFYQDVARMYVQFIKQFWTTETMVRRLGTLTPEWTDNFSAEDIAIEDDVEVDIGEMVPVNEVIRKKQAMDFLELVARGVADQGIREKLAEEGYEIHLSSLFKETVASFGVKNEGIIQKLDPDKYVKVLLGLMKKNPELEAMLGAGMSRRKKSVGRTNRAGIPSYASVLSGANRSTGIRSPIESVMGEGGP